MKTLIYITLISTFTFFVTSCFQFADSDKTVISFYTPIERVEGVRPIVIINGAEVGALRSSMVDPSCGDSLLVSIDVDDASDLHIAVRIDDQDHYLGYLNLYSPSHGIKIKPEQPNALFVKHALAESCTRVALQWQD